MKITRLWGATLAALPALALCVGLVWAFAEEPLYFRDPYTDSLRTDEALRAVYAELSARSVQREGLYWPLDLNAPLSGTETLSDMLSVFVHGRTFDQADRIVQAVLAAPRTPIRRIYLPLVTKQ